MLITGGDIDSNHRTSAKELICKRILFSHRKYYDLKNKIIKRKENTKQVKYMRLKTNNTSCILILLIEEYI